MAKLFLDEIHTLGAKALRNGGRMINASRIAWDISGNCTNPYTRELYARPSPEEGKREIVVKRGSKAPMTIELKTRCRGCEKCLRARAWQWKLAATAETSRAQRTWFATLTLSPDQQHRALSLARAKAAAKGEDFDTFPEAERFQRRHNEIQPEVTKMLKRIRKNTGAKIRYLLVAEAHVSGAPHYHMLIHECDGSAAVKYDALKREWRLGFSKFKLVTETRQATYLCKYLSKSMMARVRASIGYGSNESERERNELNS